MAELKMAKSLLGILGIVVLLSIGGCVKIAPEKQMLANITDLVISSGELPKGWTKEGVYTENCYEISEKRGNYFKGEPSLNQLHLTISYENTTFFDGWISRPIYHGWVWGGIYSPEIVPSGADPNMLLLTINEIPIYSINIDQFSEGFLYLSVNYTDGTSKPSIPFEGVNWDAPLVKPIQKIDHRCVVYIFTESRKLEFPNATIREFVLTGFSHAVTSTYTSLIIQEDPNKIILNSAEIALKEKIGKPVEKGRKYKESGLEYSYEMWDLNDNGILVLKVKESIENKTQKITYASQFGDYLFKLNVAKVYLVKVNGNETETEEVYLVEKDSDVLFRTILQHAKKYDLNPE